MLYNCNGYTFFITKKSFKKICFYDMKLKNDEKLLVLIGILIKQPHLFVNTTVVKFLLHCIL